MYVQGIRETIVSDSAKFLPGQLGMNSDGRVYRYVQYQGGAGSVAAVVGQVTYYWTEDGYKNNQVTSDLADSRQVGAGVLHSAPNSGQWCWIQIKGPITLSINLTAGTDGDPLTPTGATNGTLDVVSLLGSHTCAYAGDISERDIICDFPF